MPWVKITNERYENSETNTYTSYLPADAVHLDFWYLHDGSTDKTIDGKSTLQEFGISDELIASDALQEMEDILTEIETAPPADDPPAGVGHNSGVAVAADRLRSLVDRIERLEEEKKAIGSDIKDIFSEAKSAGFDVKVLRALIRLRQKEPAEIEEMETLLDVYRRALGM